VRQIIFVVTDNQINDRALQPTMKRFLNWVKSRIVQEEPEADTSLRVSGVRVRPKPAKKAPKTPEKVDFSPDLGGQVADGGPGKNVLIRNKYVREDTGTHETLKILDDSLLDSDEETGEDPYNTGRFDRAKSWSSSRSRK